MDEGKKEKDYRVEPYEKDCINPYFDYPDRETRYRVVDSGSGKVLDDAQGYGYKTAAAAYRAFSYKKAHGGVKGIKALRHMVSNWEKKHPDIMEEIEYESGNAAREEEPFGPDEVREILKRFGKSVPFDPKYLLRRP